jgi:Reverse transcriptase (RNA-dependent DNA polymerase)
MAEHFLAIISDRFWCTAGSVLSPLLFAIYLDDIVDNRRTACHNYIILYADDILLISTSVCGLQTLLNVCQQELTHLDMSINVKKIVLYAYWSTLQ